MTIFTYGSIPHPDPSEPQPDPAWDYADIWPNLCDLTKLSQDLQAFTANIEDATPESDQELRARLALLQGLIAQALNKLESGERVGGDTLDRN